MRKLVNIAMSSALVAATALPNIASAKHAPVLYGGGATLPAIAYVGPSFFTTGSRLTNPADTGSLFGSFSQVLGGTPTVSYCQTGSGFGKGVLAGSNNATGACGTYTPPVSPLGFSAPTADANFAATDSPLSSSDYATFITNKGATRTEPFQIPSIAGAIAIVYHNADVTTQLALNEGQICQIFAGTINNWSQLGYPAKPITVVYRSDGSGTSFGFTNHLSYSAVCPANHITGWSTNQTFSAAYSGGVPAGSIGSSGNGGVVNSVVATDGAIGYAEVADATARGLTTWATVDGKDPGTNLISPYKVASKYVVVDKVIGPNDANGRPTLVSLSPPVPGCVVLVDPKGYAYSTSNYPIVAVTYLTAYYSGNGVDAQHIEGLMRAPYTNAIRALTTTIATPGSGFSYLSGPNAIAYSAAGSCINP